MGRLRGFLVFLLLFVMCWASPLSQSEPLTRIAFGSCNEHQLPQPMWTPITSFDPELWIWLGDAVYADSAGGSGLAKFYRFPSPLEEMTRRFEAQKQRPEYQAFLTTTKADVIGVWDDHDYGVNDGDWTYANKSAAQQIYLDFVEEEANSPRRHQQGMYSSYVYGPQGKQVKVILLDIRYHQNAEEGDILGSEQWKWFEDEIQANTAQLTIIGSGVQVVTHGNIFGEGWKNFPTSRQRLFETLTKFNRSSAVFFLSGDVHYAEFSRSHYCSKVSEDEFRVVSLWDMTCSGLTHSMCFSYFLPQPFVCDYVFPLMLHQHNNVGEVYGYLNFGALNIEWDDDNVKNSKFTAEIRDREGDAVKRLTWRFADLTPVVFSGKTLQQHAPEVWQDCETESRLAVTAPNKIGGVAFVAMVVLALVLMVAVSVVVAIKLLSFVVRLIMIKGSRSPKVTKKD